MFQAKGFTYLILIILFIAAVLVWSAVFWQIPDNFLEVYFFDVGQGDSIFIETPAGRQVLIDGGPDKTVLAELNQVMPLYDRTIDLVVLTHPDADHITGLVEVLEYYQVDSILSSGFQKETAVYQRWRQIISQKDIRLILAQAGQKIIFPAGPTLEILWPEQSLIKSLAQKANNISVVGRLVYDQMEFLLTGDIEKDIEQCLVSRWPVDRLRSDALKVPHHGSKTSSSQEFLEAVNPQVAVISAGQDNRYGHPHPEVLERLKYFSVYRTDRDGRIKISTDGIWFEIATTE
jgi:competence protein ComEC